MPTGRGRGVWEDRRSPSSARCALGAAGTIGMFPRRACLQELRKLTLTCSHETARPAGSLRAWSSPARPTRGICVSTGSLGSELEPDENAARPPETTRKAKQEGHCLPALMRRAK